jgi:hypothetical protein
VGSCFSIDVLQFADQRGVVGVFAQLRERILIIGGLAGRSTGEEVVEIVGVDGSLLGCLVCR